jgi:hypothetical protein
VVGLDVLEYLLLRLSPAFVRPVLGELPPGHLEERLGHGVVVRAFGPQHGPCDPMGVQGLLKCARRVLASLVITKPKLA